MTTRSIRRSRERRINKGKRGRRVGIAASTALGATVLFAPSAQAANIEVDTLADDEADGCAVGACTLRDAVADAAGNAEDDLITFESSLSGSIILTQGQITLSGPNAIEINETGPNYVTVTADAASRIFDITSNEQFTLDGLDMSGGDVTGDGGAVRIDNDSARVTINNATISDNTASDDGGGIDNQGRLTMNDSFVSGNTAAESGGGIHNVGGAFLKLTSTDLTDNAAANGVGGGIANKYSFASITDSTIDSNQADEFGAGISNSLSTLEVETSEITGNGNSSTIFGGGIGNFKYASAKVTDSTISDNEAEAGGGFAHFNGLAGKYGSAPFSSQTTIKDTTINDNYAGYLGGGVFVGPSNQSDTFLVNRSTISDNSTITGSSLGGGIAIVGPNYGDVETRNSTISQNLSKYGGGVSIDTPARRRTLSAEQERSYKQEMRQSGIEPGKAKPYTGRRSASERVGTKQDPAAGERCRCHGGYGETPAGDLDFNNTTIADNEAQYTGGGIFNGVKYEGSDEYPERETVVSSTIVGNNVADDSPNDLSDAYSGAPPAAARRGIPVTYLGDLVLNYSLVEEPGDTTYIDDPSGSSIIGVDPDIAALTDNGGATYTHEPSSTSPAIDKGVDNETARDQRGELRRVDQFAINNPANDPTDIGSFERQDPTPGDLRPLRPGEVPDNCPIPFATASVAIKGSSSGESITGTPGEDIIVAGGGKDVLVGLGSADCLSGGGEGDKITGRGGDDWATGGADGDFMKGNGGDDDYKGNGGDDRMKMASGDDRAVGGSGDDNIAGGKGDDEMVGGGGDDRMFGNNGDDDLRGGAGDDLLVGGGGANKIDCGAGKDRVVVIREKLNQIAANCERIIVRNK